MLGALFVLSLPAHTTLGAAVSTGSVGNDQVRMHALSQSESSAAGYTIHTLTLASGTVVREYVAASGIVFGVAWEGPTLPDLKETLGTSFDRYVAANATRRATPLAVSTDDFVVFSAGHLRAFSGRAYLPHVIPAGVDASVIQ